MKALTVYQPWASLIMVGAKPYEFRRWSFAARFPSLVGQRIVIHASARMIKPGEVLDIVERLAEGTSALLPELARPFLDRLTGGHLQRNNLPLACGLGTAVLAEPVRAVDLLELKTAGVDSDRIDHAVWAWPLRDLEPFDAPIPRRGLQGFWHWS